MLSAIVFLPVLAAIALILVPQRAPAAAFLWSWIGVSVIDLALVVAAWVGYEPHGGFGWTEKVAWIPGAGVTYHVGVDGLSLPLLGLTAGLFLAVAIYSLRATRRPKSYVCLFLFLQSVCLGVFVALDLILFFVFFDLSIVGMFFVIAGWGHGERARGAATKFFLYTFIGSLALLLGFIGLYLSPPARTPSTWSRSSRPTPWPGAASAADSFCSRSPSGWQSRLRPCPSTPGCRPHTPKPRRPARPSWRACC